MLAVNLRGSFKCARETRTLRERWPKEEIAIGAFHHAGYAAATGLAYTPIAGSR